MTAPDLSPLRCVNCEHERAYHHAAGCLIEQCGCLRFAIRRNEARMLTKETEHMSGIELITAERQRQITEEGWTAEHDDEHRHAELLEAAHCYSHAARTGVLHPPNGWPWEPSWWKPTDDPIRNLTKAGALIAAEIDRLQRQRKTTKS